MSPSATLLILNPNAGKGTGKHLFPSIERALKAQDLSFDVAETTGPGHATELARTAVREGYSTILAAGGDGTIREVVNGIVGTSTVLGVIPIGSGNDFTKSVGIPRALEAACVTVKQGSVREIDLGRINSGYFANAVGIGFDALATLEANRMQFLRGLPLYLAAVVKATLSYSCPKTVIELDGERLEKPMLMTAVANGQYYGGGFHIAPDAIVDDGQLDVCVIDAVNRWRILHKLIHVIRGTHAQLPEVKFYRARKIRLTSPDILYVQSDGDFMPEADPHHLEIEIVPRALRLLTPSRPTPNS